MYETDHAMHLKESIQWHSFSSDLWPPVPSILTTPSELIIFLILFDFYCCSYVLGKLLCASCHFMIYFKRSSKNRWFQTIFCNLLHINYLISQYQGRHLNHLCFLETSVFRFPAVCLQAISFVKEGPIIKRKKERKKELLTSTKWWWEVPLCSTARWYNTCEDTVSFQYKTWLTAVSDLVPHVVPRSMNDPIWNEAGGATCVAGKDWNTEGEKKEKIFSYYSYLEWVIK